MRDIKFRGKHISSIPQNQHIDGRWIYGYLCDENYINTRNKEMLVDTNTIGQYTGLHDKNGKEIYEGDIVKWFDDLVGKWKIAEIKYNETYASFCRLYKSQMGLQWLYISGNGENTCEVIGNIYENPELVEEYI